MKKLSCRVGRFLVIMLNYRGVNKVSAKIKRCSEVRATNTPLKPSEASNAHILLFC